MEIFLIALCVAVFLLAIVILSPVVVAVDSRNRHVRVRWLYVLEFQMPLPLSAGEKRLYVFRRPVSLRAQQRAKKPAKPAAEAAVPRRKRASAWSARGLCSLFSSAKAVE